MSRTNKTSLGYVVPLSDIPYTSKTIFVKPIIPKPPSTVEDKGKDKINGDDPPTQKLLTIRRSPICHHCGLNWHVRPQCSLLKAQKANVKKEVPRQANYGTRLWPSIKLHGISLFIRLHGIKLQSIWLLTIKTQGIMPHGARLLNISSLSRDLFPPIIVANPRPTNPSTSKSRRRWRMIKTARSYPSGCRA
jgi:hypothetical protein